MALNVIEDVCFILQTAIAGLSWIGKDTDKRTPSSAIGTKATTEGRTMNRGLCIPCPGICRLPSGILFAQILFVNSPTLLRSTTFLPRQDFRIVVSSAAGEGSDTTARNP